MPEPCAAEEAQVHRFLRVVVIDGFDQLADGYVDAELLLKFARETLLEGFVRLALAAGKFPQAREMSADEVMRAIRDRRMEALPITVVNGVVVKSGAYPSLSEVRDARNGGGR